MTDVAYENCGYWCEPDAEWHDPRKNDHKSGEHCRVEWFSDDPLRTCWLIGHAPRGNNHSAQGVEYGATGYQGYFRPMESNDPNAEWSKAVIGHAFMNFTVDARGSYIKALLTHIRRLRLATSIGPCRVTMPWAHYWPTSLVISANWQRGHSVTLCGNGTGHVDE